MWPVRAEAPADADAVRAVHERAFAPSRVEADLVDALRASGAYVPELCLVVLSDGAVIGHLAMSGARVAAGGGVAGTGTSGGAGVSLGAQASGGHAVLALAPMAVSPEWQRRGAGSALVGEALRRAAGTAYPLVVVLGHPTFYGRLGFEPAGALGVRAPFAVPPEAWMAHRLPADRPEARGTVVYAEAFAAVT